MRLTEEEEEEEGFLVAAIWKTSIDATTAQTDPPTAVHLVHTEVKRQKHPTSIMPFYVSLPHNTNCFSVSDFTF